eukprot:363474-Chlamydomonas_euryale.AAC.14
MRSFTQGWMGWKQWTAAAACCSLQQAVEALVYRSRGVGRWRISAQQQLSPARHISRETRRRSGARAGRAAAAAAAGRDDDALACVTAEAPFTRLQAVGRTLGCSSRTSRDNLHAPLALPSPQPCFAATAAGFKFCTTTDVLSLKTRRFRGMHLTACAGAPTAGWHALGGAGQKQRCGLGALTVNSRLSAVG